MNSIEVVEVSIPVSLGEWQIGMNSRQDDLQNGDVDRTVSAPSGLSPQFELSLLNSDER